MNWKYVAGYEERYKVYDNNLEWIIYSGNTLHSIGKKVHQIDIETGEILKTFDSMTEAGNNINCKNPWVIGIACMGKQITAHGYKWKYA